jgi:hypothetical protein
VEHPSEPQLSLNSYTVQLELYEILYQQRNGNFVKGAGDSSRWKVDILASGVRNIIRVRRYVEDLISSRSYCHEIPLITCVKRILSLIVFEKNKRLYNEILGAQ